MTGAPHQPSVWDDAVAQAIAIKEGDVSSLELVEEYLDRIDRYDQTLRAPAATPVPPSVSRSRATDRRESGPAPMRQRPVTDTFSCQWRAPAGVQLS